MSYLTCMDSKIKALHWYDIALIKLSTAAFALWVAKLWTPLMGLDTWVYLAISLVVAVPPLLRIFKK